MFLCERFIERKFLWWRISTVWGTIVSIGNVMPLITGACRGVCEGEGSSSIRFEQRGVWISGRWGRPGCVRAGVVMRSDLFTEGYNSQQSVGSVQDFSLDDLAHLWPQESTSFSHCSGVTLVHSSSSLLHSSVTEVGFLAITLSPRFSRGSI